MSQIIVTTPDELKAIITEVVSNAMPVASSPKELPDSITLETAIKVLDEFGFPTSKAKIYKLTSTGNMPFRKYGNKLVFSRKELLYWAEQQAKTPHNPSDALENIYKSVKRQRIGRQNQ